MKNQIQPPSAALVLNPLPPTLCLLHFVLPTERVDSFIPIALFLSETDAFQYARQKAELDLESGPVDAEPGYYAVVHLPVVVLARPAKSPAELPQLAQEKETPP